MAIKKKKISELPLTESMVGLHTIGVDAKNTSVKVSLEFVKTAADRATTAATSANSAATSANAAATGANTAKKNADTATTNANAARDAANTAAANANAKATLADQKAAAAVTATTNANTATANANAAKDAANTATTDANAARDAANTAAANANAKATLADQKATAAVTATTNANAATANANAAKDAANAAATSASTATTAANAAKDAANAATNNANNAATSANTAASRVDTTITNANNAAANANAKATLADQKAAVAVTATTAANAAKDAANTAATNTNAARDAANTAAANANAKATLADQKAAAAVTATTNANAATTNANAARDKALEVARNPTKVGADNYVYTYDTATKTYVKTDIYVKGDDGGGGFEVDEVRMSYSPNGNIFGEKYLSCDGAQVVKADYPDSNLLAYTPSAGLDGDQLSPQIRYLNGKFYAFVMRSSTPLLLTSGTGLSPWVVRGTLSFRLKPHNDIAYSSNTDTYLIATKNDAGKATVIICPGDFAGQRSYALPVSYTINTLKHLGTYFFAIAEGLLFRAPESAPTTWIHVKPNLSGFSDIAYAEGIGYMATELSGGVCYGPGGAEWESAPAGQEPISIVYDGTQFVIAFRMGEIGVVKMGDSGRFDRTTIKYNFDSVISRMYYEKGMYIVILGGQQLFCSTDTVNWQQMPFDNGGLDIGALASDGAVIDVLLINPNNSIGGVKQITNKIQLPIVGNGYIKLLK